MNIKTTYPQLPILGSIVAIVTPMFDDGGIDFVSLRRLCDWHVEQGTHGIVIVGTSGESPTVNFEEHCELIRVAVEHVKGRIPVIAGTGGNSTLEAIELTAYAKQVGANASLQVVPYYNKPTQEGMFLHFQKIAQEVDLPIILYNVPGRTVADMSNDTILRLAKVPGIIGLKDATGNLERASALLAGLRAQGSSNFAVFSGDDLTAIFLMLMGGHGNISVTANVAPNLMSKLCEAAVLGQLETAREIQFQLLSLHQLMFIEPNPIPVKWALHEMGMIAPGIRLPLTPLSQSIQATLVKNLAKLGFVK
ncbi:MAG: 4-hydroxy-tetrahydrodipicolinate synthase [Burkholderiales bacterium]|jgi:4-hydroxy-tetrahydrodipicolinate synthase|nr:4-hydroxy-tetrahydrodipicolinate synthase [Burkholderiales bacterium]